MADQRIRVIGLPSNHQHAAVYAQVRGGTLSFNALLRQGPSSLGREVRIESPFFPARRLVAIVRARMADFRAYPGSRESPNHAVLRKVLAAHGESRVRVARGLMNDDQEMELDMMLSKDSHTSAMPLTGKKQPVVTVDERFKVSWPGESPSQLIDNEGTDYGRS